MESKKDLAKIALATLILASTSPVNGQADDTVVYDSFLAAGCAAHGSPAVSNNRDHTTSGNNSYHPHASNLADNATFSSTALTEDQLLGMLNPQGRTIYFSLNSEGKALAIQLASQGSYRDKNLAVKEAQRRMNERHDLSSR